LAWTGINILEQEDFKPDLTCEFFSKRDEAFNEVFYADINVWPIDFSEGFVVCSIE